MNNSPHLADWFMEAKYGIFIHYLNGLQNDPDGPRALSCGKRTSWDECVAEFDTEKFADLMAEVGAGYVYFTVMQLQKYFCVPCATFDAITGYKPGEACARRDLVADLHKSLSRRGIRMMLYTTGDGPAHDERGSIAMKSGFPYAFNEEFGKMWSECMRELSLRYGDKVSGWWVDGCYKKKGYSDETFFRHMAPALRAGNPDTLIAFNYWAGEKGYNGDALPVTSYENYTAGEIYQGVDKNHPYPESRWSGHDQWHVLCFLGRDWAYPDQRYPDEMIVDYVKKCTDKGGVVSIDVGLYRDGTISADQLRQLKAIKAAVR